MTLLAFSEHFRQPFSRMSHRYKYVGQMEGFQGIIHAISFSNNGLTLASAGVNGVTLWSTEDMKKLNTPVQHRWGRVTAIEWGKGPHITRETLCLGTQLGYLGIWREDTVGNFRNIFCEQVGAAKEIVCLSVDSARSETRIAAGTLDSGVIVWKVDEQGGVQSIFSVHLDMGTCAASLSFHPAAGTLLVFGMHTGEVHMLNALDGEVVESGDTLGNYIGSAAVSLKKGQFAVDNVLGGFDIYELATQKFLRNLPTRWPTKGVPKHVTFGEDSRIVVGGSDHGIVYVFERKTGEILDKLHRGANDLVPAVATGDADGVWFIATASANSGEGNSVHLWSRGGGRARRHSRDYNLCPLLFKCLQYVLCGCGVLLLYQHFVENYATGMLQQNMRSTKSVLSQVIFPLSERKQADLGNEVRIVRLPGSTVNRGQAEGRLGGSVYAGGWATEEPKGDVIYL